MQIGKSVLDVDKHTYVMGILNVTPDSFSDGGEFINPDKALWHAEEMIAQGAAIIDVGGESTRPGHSQISDEEEIERVVGVIEALKARFDIPVSIDTYKSKVAKEAISAGADLVNDIWGFLADDKMAALVAQKEVACCLMHNRKEKVYQNYLEDVKKDLEKCIIIAKNAGVKDDRIILDPGVGFAKSYQQNLQIIHRLEILKELGYPLLLGTSRKSVVGLTLDLPVKERVEGTLATTVLAVVKGCGFVRVHDVKENVRIIKMTEAILRS